MTAQSNKNTPNPTCERASAPETRGSVTIEAAVGIPMFLFAALCLIWLIELQSIKISILNAAQNAAKSAAETTSVVHVLNSIKLKSDIVKLIGEERIERSILDGGSSAISCLKSYVSPYSGEMNVTVEYKIKMPVPVLGSMSEKLKEQFRISAWTGYEDRGIDSEDEEIVYITDRGTVYHEDYQCSYLQLSISFIPYTELSAVRNGDGGKYYRCESCVFGEAMTGVYITGYGSRYHNSLNCSGLKRTIRAVKRAEAAGRRGCSKCTE